jgi:hypothetical protein
VTYRIDVPDAASGDLVLAIIRGVVVSVTRNGKELSRADYQLSCDHERDMAKCPACLVRMRAFEGIAVHGRVGELSRGVRMAPCGTWRLKEDGERVIARRRFTGQESGWRWPVESGAVVTR